MSEAYFWTSLLVWMAIGFLSWTLLNFVDEWFDLYSWKLNSRSFRKHIFFLPVQRNQNQSNIHILPTPSIHLNPPVTEDSPIDSSRGDIQFKVPNHFLLTAFLSVKILAKILSLTSVGSKYSVLFSSKLQKVFIFVHTQIQWW